MYLSQLLAYAPYCATYCADLTCYSCCLTPEIHVLSRSAHVEMFELTIIVRCSEQLRQWGKRGLSPSGEEDRKLPLHKLFENLQEYEQTMPALVSDVLS